MSQPLPWGILAEFDSPGALLRAARETRKAGYKDFDVHTPYPVHGMDLAMGLGRSPLGWIVTGGAFAGAATALGLQYYCGLDFPLIHQGKPVVAWQPFIVITFELTVLFSAFAAVLGMFYLNGLPQWYHPTLKSEAFRKVTDNGFFLSIPTEDVNKAKEFALQLGAVRVEELEA
jgi:hypothetical protein